MVDLPHSEKAVAKLVIAPYAWFLWPVLLRSTLRQLSARGDWAKTEREPLSSGAVRDVPKGASSAPLAERAAPHADPSRATGSARG